LPIVLGPTVSNTTNDRGIRTLPIVLKPTISNTTNDCSTIP
jgi:hypothetical protein